MKPYLSHNFLTVKIFELSMMLCLHIVWFFQTKVTKVTFSFHFLYIRHFRQTPLRKRAVFFMQNSTIVSRLFLAPVHKTPKTMPLLFQKFSDFYDENIFNPNGMV